MDNVYKCRICCRMYHDKEVVIDLSSEEAKKEQIAAKILSGLSILITDHDPLQYICRICYGQVEVNFRFVTSCRMNNAKYIESLTNADPNDVVKTEYNKFMRIPVHALFNKYQFDVKGLFDAVTSFLNDNNENLSSTRYFEKFNQYFGLNNHNSIANQLDIENDIPVGIPESSSVLEVNIPCTNEPNVDTNDIDNIHNSGIDLNDRSLRSIINTNNINHATNVNVPKNILFNAHSVMSTNDTNNSTSGIFRIMSNVVTNNVNNTINNINQSRINSPIICKNNVIKSTRFCVLSKPQSLMNEQCIETNTVQNLDSATHLNQSDAKSPSTIQSTVNNHSDDIVQSNGNGQINEISDDDVICLDDEDNDSDNNNNGDVNNLQGLEDFINPLNQWILPPPPPLININNTNNNTKIVISKPYKRKFENNKKKMIQFKRICLSNIRRVICINNNAPSINNSTEEMTVTPDIPVSTSDESSLLNQGEDMYIDVDNEPTESLPVEPETEPSRVLPNTGFHFLFSTDETVDLTTKEDNTPKKKPIIRQKKTSKPKKTVASKKQIQNTSIAQSILKSKGQLLRSSTSSTLEKKQNRKTTIALHNLKAKDQLLISMTSPATEQSDTLLTKPRPKRASAINSAAEIKNSGLFKLGQQIEGKNGNWTLPVINNISLVMLQCPICDVFLYSLESRKSHEVSKHSSLLESIHRPMDIVSTPGNTACSQQLYLFNYLQLGVISKNKTKAVHQLAKRAHLLRALKTIGQKTIGTFKCIYCIYETNLVFALFAHMTCQHLNLKCDSEKKSCLFCFLCSRILTKRTTMLKHLDACVNKLNEIPIINNSNKFFCVHCDNDFSSLIELEDHTWGHAVKY